jgi:hypothetical protein
MLIEPRHDSNEKQEMEYTDMAITKDMQGPREVAPQSLGIPLKSADDAPYDKDSGMRTPIVMPPRAPQGQTGGRQHSFGPTLPEGFREGENHAGAPQPSQEEGMLITSMPIVKERAQLHGSSMFQCDDDCQREAQPERMSSNFKKVAN